MDSYSVNGRCYCHFGWHAFDHDIDKVMVPTPAGPKNVRQVCEQIRSKFGTGPTKNRVSYNTVACGHGPVNNAGDENWNVCPGRVDMGPAGCQKFGPFWDLAGAYGKTPPPPLPPPPPPALPVTSSSGCTYERGIDYDGSDVTGGVQTADEDMCATMCSNNNACTHFTFLFGKCYQKTSAKGRKISDAAISGACGSGGGGGGGGDDGDMIDQGNRATNGKPVVLKGTLAVAGTLMMTIKGPQTSETNGKNPFSSYFLDLIFTLDNKKYTVPGYFAADGNAAHSGAASGNQWRAHFRIPHAGVWEWRTTWTNADGNKVNEIQTEQGSFVAKNQRANRGMLVPDGTRYLKYGDGTPWIKSGTDSPENMLAFGDFDQTTATHKYNQHVRDATDRTKKYQWKNGKGKGLLGGLEYLSSKGVDSIYFLTMNVNGDGNDVWPWIQKDSRDRFDCSKLDQWNLVFDAAEDLGINLHVVLQEIENDKLLDAGWMGKSRTLYYRELLARFGHHSMVINLGEENKNSVAQRRQHIQYLTKTDPYNHPIALHTFFEDMYGEPGLDVASVQVYSPQNAGDWIGKYIKKSGDAGKQWVVMMDENGHYSKGAPPDAVDPNQDEMRKKVLWPTLMAGGGGFEWYFGYSLAHNDLNAEDWRSRDRLWELSARAVKFMKALPFTAMDPCGGLVNSNAALCFGSAAEAKFVLYFSTTSTNNVPKFDLRFANKNTQFAVYWFDPAGSSNNLQQGVEINGGGWKSIGNPPRSGRDWVALIQKKNNAISSMASIAHQSNSVALPSTGAISSTTNKNPAAFVAAALGLVVCCLVAAAVALSRRTISVRRQCESIHMLEWDDLPGKQESGNPALCPDGSYVQAVEAQIITASSGGVRIDSLSGSSTVYEI
jgi:hypothetical protein